MYFKYYRNSVQESGDDVFLVLGYNVGAGGSAPNNFSVQVKFRDNGSIAIFRNGVLQKEYDRSGSNFSSARTYTSIFNPAQKYVNVLLIPFRGRELLIWTDNGTCLSHTFENLDYPNVIDTNPILPAGTFSVTVPNGKITFQCARCYFEQSGYILGAPKVFRYAPTVGDWNTPTFQTYHEYFGQGATYPTLTASIVEDTAGYPAFVPNGIKKNVRIKVAYTGASGGTNSGLYCSDGWMDPDYSSTALGHQVDITTAVESLNLSLGEDGRTNLDMTTRVERLIDLGVSQPTITGDRPIAIQLKSNHATKQWVDLFRGTLSPPEIIYEPGDGGPQFSLLRFGGEDRFGDFDRELVRFSSSVRVTGGFSKLFAGFRREQPKGLRVVSYCDLRWFTGDCYRTVGFEHISDSAPGYWWCKGTERFSRMMFQKHKLSNKLSKFDEALTEEQNMRNNGFWKIHDCGMGKWGVTL